MIHGNPHRPMLLDKYLEQNNLKLDYDLDYLADGADGQTFIIQNEERRVLKLSVIFDWNNNLLKDFKNVSDTLNNLINIGDPNFAKVFTYKVLGTFYRSLFNYERQNYVLYFYTMQKLNKLSDDEKKVFHTILSHEDKNLKKDFSDEKIDETLHMLSYGLDFDAKGVKLLCDGLKKSKIQHNDLHERNIMKDDNGRYLMVDFDRCHIKKGKT